MIGIGGWRNRSLREGNGPLWLLQARPAGLRPLGGECRLAWPIACLLNWTCRIPNHPITKGLPRQWMHAGDELYATLRGPGKNMKVLATAHSDPANKGTGRDEPILMVLSYGRGRIFHTTMGHDIPALACVGFLTTLQRGAEWAATGKVTQKVPAAFPTANTVSYTGGYCRHATRPPGLKVEWLSPENAVDLPAVVVVPHSLPAADGIPAAEAKNHIGRTATVFCGKVSGHPMPRLFESPADLSELRSALTRINTFTAFVIFGENGAGSGRPGAGLSAERDLRHRRHQDYSGKPGNGADRTQAGPAGLAVAV